jgi:hypothetical protein
MAFFPLVVRAKSGFSRTEMDSLAW